MTAMTQKYFEKKSVLVYLIVCILSGGLFFLGGYTIGSSPATPIIAGEWFLKSYNSTGIPIGKGALITIAQDPDQRITLFDGTLSYEGYVNKKNIILSAPCINNQECDSSEISGIISEEILSGTWKDIKNEKIVKAGRWLAEKNHGDLKKCPLKEATPPNINGNWSFKIFNNEGLAEEATIMIFQEGQRITIRGQEEEFQGYIAGNELFAYSFVPDNNEIIEIEGAISGNTLIGEWVSQTGRSLAEEGTWEAQRK